MRTFSAALLLVLAGCDLNILGPDTRYVNRRPLAPVPPVYAAWYAITETCLGLRGDFASVRWFVADSVYYDGRHVLGLTDYPDTITLPAVSLRDVITVRHESAHHIHNHATGSGGHHTSDGGMVCDGAH